MAAAALAVVAVVATIAAAAASAYATYQSSQATAKAQKYNAKVAARQAEQEKAAAKWRADQERERNRRMVARARNIYGSSGLEMDVGSPLLVVADSARQGEKNALAIEYGGDVRAEGLESQARLDRFLARSTEPAGTVNAGITLLGGIASAAGTYTRYSGANPNPRSITVPGGYDQSSLGSQSWGSYL